ncbi:hypothetical protein M8J77_003350 [Diaphorina citri]|nr:hypothetical protein M8J77_003350 [Diaphorina citri]
MYSVVAHQQNYGRKERRPEPRPQTSNQQQSSSHQEGSGHQGSSRRKRKPFTVRLLDYIKRRFNPVKASLFCSVYLGQKSPGYLG